MPYSINPDTGELEWRDRPGGAAIDIVSIDVDAATAPGTDPVLADLTGKVTITGNQIAAATTANVIRTHSTAANSLTVEVQQSGSSAAENTALNGVSHFNNTDFTVSNGFVSLSNTGAGQTITGDAGGALNPIGGNWNILGSSPAAGTSPVATSGAASTLTINVQKSQALAAADATKVGLSNFSSSDFAVSATGFVTLATTGAAKTITGNSGGALSPTTNNWNLLGSGSLTTSGSGSTLTTQLTGLTNHAVLVGAGTTTITKLAVGTNNSILMGSTGADPAFTTTGTPFVTGISFDSGTNTLSNYATSTFTPTWTGASVAGTTTYSGSGQIGYYTRIGNIALVYSFIAITGATGTGNATLGNLPFTIKSQTSGNFPGMFNITGSYPWPASTTSLVPVVQNGTTTSIIQGQVPSGSNSPLQMANTNMVFNCSLLYQI